LSAIVKCVLINSVLKLINAAGIIVVISVELIYFKLKIDDPVGAISVHEVTGAFGTLMVGLFAEARFAGEGINGLFY